MNTPQQLNVAMKILNSVASCIQTSHLCPCLPIKHCFKQFVFAFVEVSGLGVVFVWFISAAFVLSVFAKSWSCSCGGGGSCCLGTTVEVMAAAVQGKNTSCCWRRLQQCRSNYFFLSWSSCLFVFFPFFPPLSTSTLFFPCPSFFLKSGCCSWILIWKNENKKNTRKKTPVQEGPPA